MDMIEFIKKEEGFRRNPYLDTLGVPTFGIGFTYITEEEADWILEKRVEKIEVELSKKYEWYDALTYNRKTVMVSMVYQLGFMGLSKFKKFIKAMSEENYFIASEEMLDSLWARQTPERAYRQAEMIRNG